MVANTDSLTSGKLFIKGMEPHLLNKDELADFRRTHLGFVFQQFHLLDTLTIAENMVLPLTLANASVKEMEQKLATMLERLGLSEHSHKRTYEISGGQAQRAAIGRALIHQPNLVLCDEPTGNLDSKATKDVLNLLTDLKREMGTTILMVTHDAEAASYCDRILFLKDGHIYNELYKSNNRYAFYEQISNVLIAMGGDDDDVSAVRFS